MKIAAYVLANFGGPRSLSEIRPFLTALLCDKEVLRTSLPQPLHSLLFSYVAAKRAEKIKKDYELIGGASPIYADTEAIAQNIAGKLKAPVLTFHRYLPALHAPFFEKLKQLPCGEIKVFPFFPQFSYATTGSSALFFQKHLPSKILSRLRWIKSYPFDPAYIKVMQTMIEQFLKKQALCQEQVFLLFSAHGLPQTFIQTGDIYLSECQASFHAIMQAFPKAIGHLCFQSKFGPGEWIRPYTVDCATNILRYAKKREHVVFVPLSFTSDHIETLFEIEQQYLPLVRQAHLKAYRLPAMNQRSDWLEAIVTILHHTAPVTNAMLIR